MPIDMGSVAAVASSLQAAGEIVKAMIGLRDTAVLQSKVIELQTVILSAQGAALSANVDQFALLERVCELEKKIADMEAWDAERQKYELKEVAAGSFAYVLKSDAEPSSPGHWLCTTCYQQGRKSLLQYKGKPKTGRESIFGCDMCRGEMLVDWRLAPISLR